MPSFIKNGEQHISAMIRAAHAAGRTEVVISGCYEIGDTVLLPSHTTLILSDCHLRMANGTFCQMFRNEHATPGVTHDGNAPDRQIRLLGRGRAILDGGEYNGLSEKTSGKDGMPHITQNNMVLFCNVDGFEIGGLQIRNQRWWALNHFFCRNGHLHDLDFCSDYTRMDEHGNRVVGLDKALYSQTYIKNSDGIDLRCGCHDILIENVTGFTEDDTVALTCLNGRLEKSFAVEGLPADLYNVTVQNVATAAYCSNVRLLNQGGTRLHDILVDGVRDTSENCPHLDRGGYGVRIGDTHMYGSGHSAPRETYNITVKNVRSRGNYAVCLAGSIENLILENIEAFDGAQGIEDLR